MIYIGYKSDGTFEVFSHPRGIGEPTAARYPQYGHVTGPWHSRKDAQFWVDTYPRFTPMYNSWAWRIPVNS